MEKGNPAPPLRVTQTPSALRVALPIRPISPVTAGFTYAGTLSAQAWRQWEQCKSTPSFDAAAYLRAWIPMFFIGFGSFALLAYALNRMQSAELLLDKTHLRLRQKFGWSSQTCAFDLGEMRNLRLVRPFGESVKQALREKRRLNWGEINVGGVGSRALCFDYRGKIIKLGAGLSEAQSGELLPLLLQYIPVSTAPPTLQPPASTSPQAFSA